MDNQSILVSIRCTAYNHEKYIRQCLDGFVMQKTNFRFEAIVHDDASTDGTAKIIREYAEKYPQIIIPIIEAENQFSKGNGILTKILDSHMKGKYIAFCEGDDYWTDPYKLQKQVDFLESNPEYGLVYCMARRYDDSSSAFVDTIGGPNDNFTSLLQENTIPTLTVMYIKKIADEFIIKVKPHNHDWQMGDYPLWLYIAYHSKIKFLSDVVGVYRILDNSASHSTNFDKIETFVKSIYRIRKYYCDYSNRKYEMDEEMNRRLLSYSIIYGNRNHAKFYLRAVKINSIKAILIKLLCSCDFLFNLAKKIQLKRMSKNHK